MTRRKTPRAQPGTLDRRWHLARTPIEIDVAELEYALMRSFEAFGRWQAECLANVVDFAASGPENALLHPEPFSPSPQFLTAAASAPPVIDGSSISYCEVPAFGCTSLNTGVVGLIVKATTSTTGGSTVPEPATLGLFGFGLAGLTFYRRRKRA